MGPDPFNMPAWGSFNNTQALQQSTNQLAPYATQWHGPAGGVAIQQVVNQPKAPAQGGALSKFAHFIGGVGSEIGHLAGGAATWLAHNVEQGVEAPFKAVHDIFVGHADNNAITSINAENTQLSSQLDNLHQQFKSGLISSKEYQSALKDINSGFNSLVQRNTILDNKIQQDKQRAVNDVINTAADALLFVPAVGAEFQTAKSFLFGATGQDLLAGAEQNIGKLAVNKALFAGLSDGAKQAVQHATAEVVANSAKMTAGDIARSAAINLAIKYPIYYNYLSTTGSQIYNELDNKKYGDALRTIGFNAALLLSGGPIGQALKYGKAGASSLLGKTFGSTAFLDELSKGIGNGDPAGLFNAINKLPVSERADVIKQMSAVEATNLGAVGGHDASAAAMRVLKGMESYEGLSMSEFTHEEALNNMVNFAKAQRIADEAAKAAGLSAITVGRVDARTLDNIAESLVNATAPEDRLTAWEMLKKTAPNSAWANNENLDRQIKSLIAKHENPSDLVAAIGRIKASFQVDGIPKSVSETLAKMGYIPIKPTNLEAPFAEGTGKVTSRFAQNDEFFTKSVQPLPILSSLGKLVTNLGLSPYASQQRVYQIFNDNLAKNLQESGIVKKIMGEDIKDSTDTMIKKLSSYAHNPTRGRFASKMPITDLRQLTTADIKTALDVSTGDAKTIQEAIARSFIQVPFVARGLGDRLVDATYSFKPTGAIQRRYLRLQGAARFSWNPFFQYLRLIPKTETLAEFEGGGFVKSVFAGRLGEIRSIREGLRAGGFLEERGGLGNVVSGEAVDFGGSMSRNLSKRLLPAQEQSIAGLVDAQARRMGMDWQTYIKENPQQVRDTIQMIAEYDRRGSFINSPLMRTLNIAFFPLRFDVKVAQIMARSLARTSLMTQVSVVNGLLRAHDWLNSPEGQAWYSQNADVIGLLEYVSPFAKMNEVFQSLVPGHDHSLGNFGEVGGLPFGWIPQILDAEGLTQFNQPGVNPKTGAIYPDYIPITQRGQLATAIQDFLGSLFSYPGVTVGLPSKSKITLGLSEGVTGANKSDFNKVTPAISGQQQDYASLIQQLSGTTPQQNPAPLPTAPLRQGTTVPSTAPPLPPGKTSSLTSRSGSRSTKKKKAQFTPELLPGQTTFGQL